MSGMNHVDLFSGIGGFALAARWAGYETIQFCEIEPFCHKVLIKNFPGVPIHADIVSFAGQSFRGRVDLLTAGFPCQDISAAGKGEGLTGSRSGLWFEALRVITECRPTRVVIENVPALRTRGIDTVLEGLETAGYTCWPLVVGADDVGATHRRKRVWIVGVMDDAGHMQGRRIDGQDERDNAPTGRELHHGAAGDAIEDVGDAEASRYAASLPERITETVSCVTCSSGTVEDSSCEQDRRLCESELHRDAGRTVAKMADANTSGREEQCGSDSVREEQPAAECNSESMAFAECVRTAQPEGRERDIGRRIEHGVQSFPPGPSGDWSSIDPRFWPVELEVRRQNDGIPGRLVRRQLGSIAAILRGLGNAVVPEVAYRVIMPLDSVLDD